MDEKYLGYVAALIDGEGSCFIQQKQGKYLNGMLNVEMSDKRTIQFIQTLFEGKVSSIVRKDTPRTMYRWSATNYSKTLKQILPYMITKEPQAILLLTFQNLQTGEKVTPESLILKKVIKKIMTNINRKGMVKFAPDYD